MIRISIQAVQLIYTLTFHVGYRTSTTQYKPFSIPSLRGLFYRKYVEPPKSIYFLLYYANLADENEEYVMANLYAKNFSDADEVKTPPKARVEV